ncbi:MAG: Lrp/AsnC ligand binding domain-containing protein [Chloroflexi bacterium]|nr:Lrp/AsnC ligand binding domain-containing protein [Chloroflexota bacterium]MBV9544983.1 Lrp/AsnC ligand binding domain-containing protein [Chloroflexota bacterium]
MITAIVLIHTQPGQTATAGEALAELADVAEVYSVTGEYDLVAIVRVRRYEQMAAVVPQHIASVPGVARTHTLMAFQHFSRHDLDRMWGIGLEAEPTPDA